MAQVWRFPLTPLPVGAGVAVTAAALTGSGIVKLPQIPPSLLVEGGRLSLRATGELTSTSATPTVVLDFRLGAVGSAIGSKTAVLAASSALVISSTATGWPFIMTWDGTLRTLSPSAGVIHGQGTVKVGFGTGTTGLTSALAEFPMPITAALRTVSNLNTSQVNEIDVGVTLSSVTGTPSVLITDLWAELSG